MEKKVAVEPEVEVAAGTKLVKKQRKKLTEEQQKKDKATRGCIAKFMGLEVKKGVTVLNVISLFLIFLMGGLSGNGTVLQTVYLLGAAETKDEEKIDDAKSTAYEMGKIELYYIIAACISAPIIGYLYEMTTRKFVLSLSILFLAIFLAIQFLPQFKEKKALLTFASVLTGTMMYALMGNPLIMDYIKKYSRGRASAL